MRLTDRAGAVIADAEWWREQAQTHRQNHHHRILHFIDAHLARNREQQWSKQHDRWYAFEHATQNDESNNRHGHEHPGTAGQTGQQAGQQASQGVGAISSAVNGARAAVASFLAVYAGIQTLSGVVRLADEYQSLSDRLRLATGDSAAFQAAQAGVFAVAQQTGTALSAVGGLYVSLSNSTRELDLAQSDLLTIMQAISQSFIVSGASAASTDAAVRQLAQGFASGVLRGDEFNSVMENAPALARALADSLGVTIGELRAMAAEGKLTSDVLAQGLLQQAPQIASQFEQMGTTVGQAFTRLQNATLQFVG